MTYPYANVGFSQAIAYKLIEELLTSSSRGCKFAEVKEQVIAQHLDGGGTIDINHPDRAVMAVLCGMVSKGTLRYDRVLRTYQYIGTDNALEVALEDEELDGDQQWPIQRDIGEGLEAVYLFYAERDRRVRVELDGGSVWECKIGMTTRNVRARIMEQCSAGMTYLPVIGLVIRCDDAEAWERQLHRVLNRAGCRVERAIGVETFLTNPEIVERLYQIAVEADERCLMTVNEAMKHDERSPA